MKVVKYKIFDLKPAEYNPRKLSPKQENDLKNSLLEFGLVDPIIININPDRKNIIIGGHQRLKVWQKLGNKEIDCVEVNLSPEKERELNVRLNKNTGEFDFDILLSEFEFDDLVEWGFEIDELDIFEDKKEAKEDDFDVDVSDKYKTDILLGDLFEIGKHRLLCGDSTKVEDVEKLMNGKKADIGFTSPPYNAGQTPTEIKMGKKSKYLNNNDNKSDDDYLHLLVDFTLNSIIKTEYSFVNIQSLSGNKTVLIDYLHELKEIYADTLIWDKLHAQPAMAENVLNSQYEYVHCFSQKANRAIGVKTFRGTISNVLSLSKQTQNEVKEHNATFPIGFVSFFISNFSNNSVLDLFLGSGTTMLASHQLNRKCYGMELDPIYCDVIVRRMLSYDNTLTIKRNGIDETSKWLEKIKKEE